MKLMIYEFLTKLIIEIARLRTMLGISNCYRFDRDAMNTIPDCVAKMKVKCYNLSHFNFACCDCDLTHNLRIDKQDGLHCIPIRPEKYGYRLR